jgi:eukaryotic translation initiation factor 2C
MIEEHLRIFAKENDGDYPERILVFRDGISEGQYAAALQYEHNAIVTACDRVLPGYRPRILVCVCARRHNTRFFAKNHKDADRSGNLQAGLVVDKSVTHPYAFDFFLQAHAGLVGTARPTHYICLIDELGTTPDQLQKLCNSLSYSFARCTKAVSLVPVCYMAGELDIGTPQLTPDLVCQKARFIVQSNDDGATTEYSGSRAPSRYGGTTAPSAVGTEATAMRRQLFEQTHDIMQIQKLLSKNEELSRVAWWM